MTEVQNMVSLSKLSNGITDIINRDFNQTRFITWTKKASAFQ